MTESEIKVFGYPSAFGLVSFDPATLAVKIFLQVNEFKWTDVDTNDYTSVQSKMLPMIEVNGKQISGLQDIISYLSGELLGRPLTFIEKETVNLIEIKLNSKLMEDMFAEPIYSNKIKSLLFHETPFYRVFYDSWTAASYFKSKANYSKKFLTERSVDDVLTALAESDILKSPSFSAPTCTLLGYLFVALRLYALKNEDSSLRLHSSLIDFATRSSEELLSIPFRGTNRLMSTVDQATTSPSSSGNQSDLLEHQNGIIRISNYVPVLITVVIVTALGVRFILLPKKE